MILLREGYLVWNLKQDRRPGGPIKTLPSGAPCDPPHTRAQAWCRAYNPPMRIESLVAKFARPPDSRKTPIKRLIFALAAVSARAHARSFLYTRCCVATKPQPEQRRSVATLATRLSGLMGRCPLFGAQGNRGFGTGAAPGKAAQRAICATDYRNCIHTEAGRRTH
jgi:hypothetical protein